MRQTRWALSLLVSFPLSAGLWAQVSTDVPIPPFRHVEPPAIPPENLALTGHTHCAGGKAAGFDCQAVDLLSILPFSELGGGGVRANDLWGWTDPASKREFVLLGLTNGTAFVEVTDPLSPVYLGRLPTHTTPSSWRDMKVYKNHTYIVSEARGHGMQVFALDQLLDNGVFPKTFKSTIHYGAENLSNAHNIAINEESGFAYVVGSNTCRGGLHMVNIEKPRQPRFAGCVSSDGYTHDTQCVTYQGPDAKFVDREICVSFNEDTVTIVDVQDKTAPRQLSRTSYRGVSYTHQGWLSEDHLYLLTNDEGDELDSSQNTKTYVWDVSSLTRPRLIRAHPHNNRAIDHNLYIYRDVAYEANYRAGLRVFSLEKVANGELRSLGWFDIFRTDNAASYNGAWSVYPFFESGTIAVSGIEQGLFLVDPRFDGFVQ